MADPFAAQMSKWVLKSNRRIEEVFKESVQDVFSEAQTAKGSGGNMPIDTGFLRASLVTDINGTNSGHKPVQSKAQKEESSVPILTILDMDLGDTITGIWTANYAAAVNNGISADPATGRKARDGEHFIDKAAQQWRTIVSRNSQSAEALN